MPFIRYLLSHKSGQPVFMRQFMSPLRDLCDGLWRIKPEYGTKSDITAYSGLYCRNVKKLSI